MSEPASILAPPRFDGAFRQKLDQLFHWRRDVRRFRRDPVEPREIEELIRQAAMAPSVGNSQPWRFVIIEDERCRQAIRENFAACNCDALKLYAGERAQLYARLKLAGLEEAPVHLAVFVDTETCAGHGLGRQTMPETLAYSVVGAVHTFWLAARARGVGVGWVSILDPAAVRAVLDVPRSWSLIAYLCVGYPEEEHLDPELERHRWQQRQPLDEILFRR